MQIIAGRAKGRKLAAPPAGTRPMTGRAKESIFSILQWDLEGARVLDLFAGSGGLGLEALSRGAATAVFVEKSKRASRVLEDNIEAVGLGGSVVVADAATALKGIDGGFDIVFVDPPYAMSDTDVAFVVDRLVGVCEAGALVIVHRQAASSMPVSEFLAVRTERRYGDACVTVYERIDP